MYTIIINIIIVQKLIKMIKKIDIILTVPFFKHKVIFFN